VSGMFSMRILYSYESGDSLGNVCAGLCTVSGLGRRMCPECSRCVFYTHTKVAIRLVTCVQVCVLSVDWAGECVRNVLDAYFILIRKWRFAW
jgi:hypothetical protein